MACNISNNHSKRGLDDTILWKSMKHCAVPEFILVCGHECLWKAVNNLVEEIMLNLTIGLCFFILLFFPCPFPTGFVVIASLNGRSYQRHIPRVRRRSTDTGKKGDVSLLQCLIILTLFNIACVKPSFAFGRV